MPTRMCKCKFCTFACKKQHIYLTVHCSICLNKSCTTLLQRRWSQNLILDVCEARLVRFSSPSGPRFGLRTPDDLLKGEQAGLIHPFCPSRRVLPFYPPHHLSTVVKYKNWALTSLFHSHSSVDPSTSDSKIVYCLPTPACSNASLYSYWLAESCTGRPPLQMVLADCILAGSECKHHDQGILKSISGSTQVPSSVLKGSISPPPSPIIKDTRVVCFLAYGNLGRAKSQ